MIHLACVGSLDTKLAFGLAVRETAKLALNNERRDLVRASNIAIKDYTSRRACL